MAAETIDAVFWWVGAIVCGGGALIACAVLAMVPFFVLDVAFKKWADVYTFMEVVAHAKKNGRKLFSERREEKSVI